MSQKITGSPANVAVSHVTIVTGPTVVQIVGSRPGRKAVILNLESDVPNILYVGATSDFEVTNSFHLHPGDTITIETEAALWGIRLAGSADMHIGVLETYD